MVSSSASPRTDAHATPTYTIQGQCVTLPVEVRAASSISATFLVPTGAARTLIRIPRIELVELLPGRTACSLAGIEYHDNDLGQYNEVAVAFFVRPEGQRQIRWVGGIWELLRGRLGAYIHQLPVTTSFSAEAGRDIWGFPKFVAEIAFRKEAGRRTVRLAHEGRHILTLTVKQGGRSRSYREARLVSYAGHDGVTRRTPFASSGDGAHARLGGATLELGNHPIAAELRRLGLPRHAVTSACVERMRMRFEAPEKI